MADNKIIYEGIKTFKAKLDYNFGQDGVIILQVDFNVLTEELAHGMNDFWSGSEERLDNSDGDIFLAVIRMSAEHALYHLYHEDIFKSDIFKQEGYDGCGISIVSHSIDDFEIDDCEVTLVEDKNDD